MINKLAFLLLIFFSTNFFAQVQNPAGWQVPVEIYFNILNAPLSSEDYFSLEALGTVWESDQPNDKPNYFFISDNPNIINSPYPWEIEYREFLDWYGWHLNYSRDLAIYDNQLVPYLGYGLYKFFTSASNSHFYLDTRDTRIYSGNGGCGCTYIGGNPDIWLKYDYNTNLFYFKGRAPSDDNDFNEIENGAYLTYWGIKEVNPSKPNTLPFPNFWTNALVIIPSQDNHPRLVWGPYPSTLVSSYIVQRKYGLSPWNDSFATVSNNQFEYTDNTISINQPGQPAGSYVQYRIRAVLEENSYASNTAGINISGEEIEKRAEKKRSENKLNCEVNNYPNPFNPSTVITYSLAEGGFTSLKVFDVLGNEITALVNEYKTAGSHTVNFDGIGLTSGVYFYTLISGGVTASKKMILAR